MTEFAFSRETSRPDSRLRRLASAVFGINSDARQSERMTEMQLTQTDAEIGANMFTRAFDYTSRQAAAEQPVDVSPLDTAPAAEQA